ncbi:hypothetical protein GCM10027570_14370 [Streptomonospora sediminis]
MPGVSRLRSLVRADQAGKTGWFGRLLGRALRYGAGSALLLRGRLPGRCCPPRLLSRRGHGLPRSLGAVAALRGRSRRCAGHSRGGDGRLPQTVRPSPLLLGAGIAGRWFPPETQIQVSA